VYRFPNSRFVANFIGRANFVSGLVAAQEDHKLTVKSLGQTLTLSSVKREFRAGEEVTLIIRPEMIWVRKTGGLYKGIVRRAVYLGDVIEYLVEVSGSLILGIETDPRVVELFQERDEVTLGFAEDCIQVLPAEKQN
jgi:iron(III) transport system ATP-binding protein